MEKPILKRYPSRTRLLFQNVNARDPRSKNRFPGFECSTVSLMEKTLHSTSECFELNHCKKRAKEFTAIQCVEKEKQCTILYKDLNAFINAKVEQAFKKKAKAKKKRKGKQKRTLQLTPSKASET